MGLRLSAFDEDHPDEGVSRTIEDYFKATSGELGASEEVADHDGDGSTSVSCPICGILMTAVDNERFNEHVVGDRGKMMYA